MNNIWVNRAKSVRNTSIFEQMRSSRIMRNGVAFNTGKGSIVVRNLIAFAYLLIQFQDIILTDSTVC